MIDWDILYKIPLGLYVLSANDGKNDVGAVVDAVMMAANQPCALAISCSNQSYTKQSIDSSLTFNLSILSKDISPEIIANFGFFSSKDRRKWDYVKYQKFHNLPVIDDALVFIHAKVIHKHELCSNTVFIAEIIDAKLNKKGEPILYQNYRGELKNEVFKSYQNLKGESQMAKKWVCCVCNYVYDGEIDFEKLGDDYVCPICGVDKSFFELRDVE